MPAAAVRSRLLLVPGGAHNLIIQCDRDKSIQLGNVMTLRSFVIAAVLLLLALFAALNWTAFTAPTRLSLLVSDVEAPLGLIMLSVTALLAVLFLVFIVAMQTSVLREARRNARELQAQRELADRAEASRFTELREFLEKELAAMHLAVQTTGETVSGRVDLAERSLRDELEQATNTLSAYIGEVEDRMERNAVPGAPRH
jgi:uncharacterized integral membrane protein